MTTLFTSRSPLPLREKQYRTRDGDVVDALCNDHYGSYDMLFINAVFRRNPIIVNQGLAILPAGLLLIFPLITPEQASTVRQFMEWPAAPLIGFNIPALPSTITPPPDYEVTPAKVVAALEEFRRQRIITKIPFYEEPPNPNIPVGYADDPFAQDPPTGIHPASVNAAAQQVANKKKSLNDDLFIWFEWGPDEEDPVDPFPPIGPYYPPRPYWYKPSPTPMTDPGNTGGTSTGQSPNITQV